MTSNDAQIDLLLRRHGKQANSETANGHLDADELAAFAEGSVPPATRMRYVSHLSNCDDCRRLATQLTASVAAPAKVEHSQVIKAEGRSLWQSIAAVFALPAFRFATVAVVLLAVGTVTFIALRRPGAPESNLVAQNESANSAPPAAVKPVEEPSRSVGDVTSNGNLPSAKTGAPSPAPSANLRSREDEFKATSDGQLPAAPKSIGGTTEATSPVMAKKSQETEKVQTPSTYSPPPPGESQQAVPLRGQQTGISGPRKSDQQQTYNNPTQLDRGRDAEVAKEGGLADQPAQKNSKQAPGVAAGALAPRAEDDKRASDDKLKGPSRNTDNVSNRSVTNTRNEAEKTEKDSKDSNGEERAAETRSVGGRKFRRQNNSWVDQKFKPSSMSLKSVARGSDEFQALDSGLRSIAQQLGGEIIVVWKGKAYLIK